MKQEGVTTSRRLRQHQRMSPSMCCYEAAATNQEEEGNVTAIALLWGDHDLASDMQNQGMSLPLCRYLQAATLRGPPVPAQH
ncbi:hypothetical protein Q3G72_029040 [Acer saccharum]|nr:hypothetical protein Q3G72_029040 [Acer saccharum]